MRFIDYLQSVPGPELSPEEEARIQGLVSEIKRLALACKVEVRLPPPVRFQPDLGDRLIGLYHPAQEDDAPLVLVVVKGRRTDGDTQIKFDGFVWSA